MQSVYLFVYCFALFSNFARGSEWTQLNVPPERWLSAAMSSSGKYAVAGCDGCPLYYSSDYGVNLILSNSPAYSWRDLAMSSSGQYAVAVSDNYGVFMSSSYGVTWFNPVNYGSWSLAAMSDSGQFVLVHGYNDYIWRSVDFGVTFYPTGPGGMSCSSLALTTDGVRCFAYCNGYMLTSADSGYTWYTSVQLVGQYAGLAINGAGTFAIMGNNVDGTTVFSKDYGVTWASQSAPYGTPWSKFACDSTGQLILAVDDGDKIYMSFNFGTTFDVEHITTTEDDHLTSQDWVAVAVSANGGNAIAFDHFGNAFRSSNPFPFTTGHGHKKSNSSTVAAACGSVFGVLGFGLLVFGSVFLFRALSRTAPDDPYGNYSLKPQPKGTFAAGDPFAPAPRQLPMTGASRTTTEGMELNALESQGPVTDLGTGAVAGGDAAYSGYLQGTQDYAVGATYPFHGSAGGVVDATATPYLGGAGGLGGVSAGSGGGATIVPIAQPASNSWGGMGSTSKREW